LQREGFEDNHKRVCRLYREEGLSLRLKRPKRKKSARLRQPKHFVTAINQIWSMNFVADALFDGRRLRALTIVDNYTRESLAIEVGQSLKGEDVVNTLNHIATRRGLPSIIKVDNGSEFISKVMDKWAYERGIELDFSRLGKPTDNAKVESFNGRCGRSASTPTGSCPWRTPGARLTSGGSTITRGAPTLHCSGQHPLNSPAGQGKAPCPAGLRSRNFPL
jgi:putative transposase